MKSMKPGRGPSMMGGVGSVVAIVFGVFWTILAAGITSGASEMGAPGIISVVFPLFVDVYKRQGLYPQSDGV